MLHPNFTHGFSIRANPASEYRAWSSMKSRCTNSKDPRFENYGARGIRVCERWLTSFEDFLADIGRKPSPDHTLDRYPDNAGNYEPGNVRWATRAEQQANRRNTLFVEIEGQKVTFVEACARTGIDHNTAWMRIDRGWAPERAVLTPVRKR